MRSTVQVLVVVLAAGLTWSTNGTARQAGGEITIRVPEVPGPYCVYGIEKRLTELPEVADVRLLWEEDEIRVALRPGAVVSREQIEEAIERAEYPYSFSIEM